MYIVDRSLRFVRGFLLSYGPSNIKRRFWDKEYSEEKWSFAYNTVGDCVYPHLERHAAGGSILDIGCGSGNTATEMAETSYRSYLGVDISEAALAKARRRSQECGRQDKNHFECGDFLSYVPTGQYDVILFRESMYHVPLGKVKSTLDRYSKYLKDGWGLRCQIVHFKRGQPRCQGQASAGRDVEHHGERIRSGREMPL